jgi:uncharacterized protein YgiM (DUF1202 family)
MVNKYKKYATSLLAVIALTSVATATTLADDYMYVKAAHLNIRAAGTVRAKIVATVDSGYKVTVLESLSNGWKKVLLENGETGFVNGGYLISQEPAFEKVTSARYTIQSGSAFMRAFDLKRKVAVLNQGDILEVTSEKVYLNRWIQVRVVEAKHDRYVGRTGYVAKRLLAPVSGYEYVAPEETAAVEDTSVDTTTTDETSAPEATDPFEMNSAPAQVTTPADTDT